MRWLNMLRLKLFAWRISVYQARIRAGRMTIFEADRALKRDRRIICI